MRVMTDTNILFSALLFPESKPAKALFHATERQNLILCDYIVAELRSVVARKRPDLLADIDEFLARLPCELISAPRGASNLVSDPKDHPIINAALIAGVEIIISGDKHFLELGMERPRTMSATAYLDEVT